MRFAYLPFGDWYYFPRQSLNIVKINYNPDASWKPVHVFIALKKVLVNNPHDKLIKIVFSDRTKAEAYFKQNLPPKLVEQIDWDTLKLEGTQYIDDES